MFNGIIKNLGTVDAIEDIGGGKRLRISCAFSADLEVDESVNVNGVCQTVVKQTDDSFEVQVIEETLRKTSLGSLSRGDRVNLERAIRLSDRISGHIVQGHVDSTGTITSIQEEETGILFTVQYPEAFKNLIVGRGSICLDGISLTVARESGNEFTVAIIPYTFEHTNLRDKKHGDPVNLEFDIFGKYAVKYLEGVKK